MKLDQKIAEGLKSKIQKVLGRQIYLFDENGITLDTDLREVDLAALKCIKESKEAINKNEGRYFSCVPLLYNEKIIGAVCAGDVKKAEASEFARLAKGLAEVLLYEEFLVKNIHIANDLRSDFIKEILTGSKIKTTEEAIDQGDIIGVNLRFKYAIMIFKLEGLYEGFVSEHRSLPLEVARTRFQDYLKEIENYLLGIFSDEIQNCIVYIGESRFVMLKEIKEENIDTVNSVKILKKSGLRIQKALSEKFASPVLVAVGQYYPGLSGLRKSFEDASIALKLGENVMPESKVFHILDVAMFVGLLSDIPATRKNELAYQVLEKLYSDQDLLRTTSVFLENGMKLTDAAKKLHLHRNTLIYRLGKVRDLIGLDPTKFHDALQIKLGLMVYSETELPINVN